MRKSNDQSIHEIISEIFETYKLKGKLDELKLRNSWEALMGKAIANRTHALTLRDGTLFIKIVSAPLSQELHYGSEKIKQMLNKEFGEEIIKEIKII
jgi:hypothetical protein